MLWAAGFFYGAAFVEGLWSKTFEYLRNIVTPKEAKERLEKMKKTNPTITIKCKNVYRQATDGFLRTQVSRTTFKDVPVKNCMDRSASLDFLDGMKPSLMWRVRILKPEITLSQGVFQKTEQQKI